MKMPRPPRHDQSGVTLIVALVMLAALGLLAAWGLKSGTTNLLIAGNTQARHEAFAAAQAAIDTTISSPTFSQNPAAVAANLITVDVDDDGNPDLTAVLDPAPTCYRWRPVKLSELDPARAADRACLTSGAAGNAGIDGPAGMSSGDSLCADSEWHLRATATEPRTQASVTINQGVAMRGLITDVVNACP